MIKFLQREFGYLTNNVRWRKWIVGIVLGAMTFNIVFLPIVGEEYTMSRWFTILGVIYAIYVIVVNVLAFNSKFFKDVPNTPTYQITLGVVSAIWNRVQIFIGIAAVSLAIYQFVSELSVIAWLFEVSAILFIYYNMTLSDSISVFIKFRVFDVDGEKHDNSE